ncbi:MAG: hypothetical protein R2735_02455 [Microthrixaceae bacterium]
MVDQTYSISTDEARFDSARLMLTGWAAEVPEGLIRKSLVVDRLLDLRAELSDEPLLIIEIDQFLASVPGQTVVEPAWWLATVAPSPRTSTSAPIRSATRNWRQTEGRSAQVPQPVEPFA